MTIHRPFRVGGPGHFVVHVVLRSVITSSVDPALFAKRRLWVPVNALGAAATDAPGCPPSEVFGLVAILVGGDQQWN